MYTSFSTCGKDFTTLKKQVWLIFTSSSSLQHIKKRGIIRLPLSTQTNFNVIYRVLSKIKHIFKKVMIWLICIRGSITLATQLSFPPSHLHRLDQFWPSLDWSGRQKSIILSINTIKNITTASQFLFDICQYEKKKQAHIYLLLFVT